MRADYETRFKSADKATGLSKQVTSVKLTTDVEALVKSLPVAQRSAWLRRVITEAAQKELLPEQA